MVWSVENVELRPAQAERLASDIRAGRKRVVVGPDGRGKTELLFDVKERLGSEAVVLQVPSGLDQTEAVILDAARLLGDDALREVDERLRAEVDDVRPALVALRDHLGGRKLLVDDLDSLWCRTGDAELRVVVQKRAAALEAWFRQHAALCSVAAGLARAADWTLVDLPPVTDPPCRLLNGGTHDVQPLWERVDADVSRFRLALTLAQIHQRPPDPDAAPLGRRDDLFEAIWEALPQPHREILVILAVHERPLPDEILKVVIPAQSDPVIEEVRSLAAIGDNGRGMWVDTSWQRFLRAKQPAEELTRAHLALATAFAGELDGREPNAWARATFLVEAHRHYAAGGEAGRALQFARYGVALLLAQAREQSMRREFISAVEGFESVLRLDEQLRERSGAAGIGVHARAYAIHYLHYNRHKSKPSLESIAGTEEGYRSSVDLWPENALFWSRLALTIFLENEPGRALQILAEAREKVPDHSGSFHSGKEWYLRARTVQHLLRYQPPRALAALRVWADYRATDLPERVVERALWSELSRGIRTTLLDVPDSLTVHLQRDIKVQIMPAGKAFACTLWELGVSARGDDGLSALSLAVAKLRKEVERFRTMPTHKLGADERAQKQRLLGNVDLVASRLLGEVPTTTWVLGRIIAGDDGKMRLREVGSDARTFELCPSVEPPLLPDASARLARVRTGPAGEPIGPVIDLEEPLGRDPARIWAEWRKRLGESETTDGQ